MGDCQLSEQRLCKYAFAPWCPTCSPSCRPRNSVKQLSKTFDADTNTDNVKELWVRPIRPNFCDIPTTYINEVLATPPRSSSHPPAAIAYETSTFFDRDEDASRQHSNGIHEYNKEVDYLREKLQVLKETNTKNEVPIIRSQKCVQNARIRSRILAKNKARVGSAKLRARLKVLPPANIHSPSSSDSEDADLKALEQYSSESTVPSLSTSQDSTITNGKTPSNCSKHGDAPVGDFPLRPSLFPNIPPYIKFNAHNDETPFQISYGKRLFKWKLSTITPVIVRKTLSNTGFALVRKSSQWMGTWGKHMKSPMFKTLKEAQKLNHFPGTFQLGRKDRLWKNVQRLVNRFGYKEFGFLPYTYVLPQEMRLLKQNWEHKKANGIDTWIVKPPASARGVGIKVINKWSQLPKKCSVIVQQYITDPYLINESKFDLRLYVLVTSFHPLRIYLYPEGLARFASAKYSRDAKDLADRYVHLTNYSINKLSSQYTINEDANECHGHKWTLTKLLELLREKHCVDTGALWSQLKDLVIKTVISAEPSIVTLCQENLNNTYNSYELFGIDVLIDEHLKCWLLEVNISPSLHSASPLDAHVKGPMVQDLFNLVQFHLPPRLSLLAPHLVANPSSTQNVNAKHLFVVHNPKLYTNQLLRSEKDKHLTIEAMPGREQYLNEVLSELNGDDVRKLCQAEDEWTAKGQFERIFPTSQTHTYLKYMQPRYYNRLFDAWECKYESNREGGIEILRQLCHNNVHLKVPSASSVSKNGLNMSHGCDVIGRPLLSVQPSTKGSTCPDVFSLQELVSAGNISSTLLCNGC